MANPIVTSLPAYVEQNRTDLINKSVLVGRTVDHLNLMTGVVGPTSLNLYDTDLTLQDGKACGFDAQDTTTLSQRVLTPAILKVNTTFCPKNLIGKYAQHLVKVGAGRENLPFEEKFTQGIVDAVKAEIEKMVWQGQPNQTDECEGFISILSGATSAIKVAEVSGTTASKAIEDTYMAMPAAIVEKGDAVIFVGEDIYRAYIQALVKANMYHYDAKYGEGVYVVPGTSVRVISVNGLNGTNAIVAGRESNFYYGTDMENDNETFDLWWSKDDQIWKLAINFTAGVQVAYPEEAVLTTIATA